MQKSVIIFVCIITFFSGSPLIHAASDEAMRSSKSAEEARVDTEEIKGSLFRIEECLVELSTNMEALMSAMYILIKKELAKKSDGEQAGAVNTEKKEETVKEIPKEILSSMYT